MPIRVLLVELPSLLRETVRAALDPDGDIVVIGEADSGDHAVEEARKLRPDIAFMVAHVPDMDGIDVIEAIREASPSTKVILFMEASGARIPEAIRAGRVGVPARRRITEDLVDAARLAVRDKAVVDPTLVRPLLEAVQATGERDEGPHLSRRDRAIMHKVSSGEPIEENRARTGTLAAHGQIRLKRIFETLAVSGPPNPPRGERVTSSGANGGRPDCLEAPHVQAY